MVLGEEFRHVYGINYFDKLASLRMPSDKYIIVGGAVLKMLGIRHNHNIDIIVKPELWKNFSEQLEPRTEPILSHQYIGFKYIKAGPINIYRDLLPVPVSLATRDSIWDHYNTVAGYRFMRLTDLINWKNALIRILGRFKDIEDYKRAKRYMECGLNG